ncbi:hypothetical protein Goari_005525 [Gossypium aridum]|uniref:Uncharacterized protein n=1 Tax=Gossypium aridum TaxID=34290 RepID=A0A7J8YQ64_GOSAI|nr:hypothetical protein [Gossypium aridum]
MWTFQTGTTIPQTFNQELMTPKAKMWMKLVCAGKLIYKNMVECARNLGKGIFFPHLVTKLCKRAGVLIERMDKTMNPSRKLLGDDKFKQYVLLQTK